jgi:hypothetical protein
MRRVVAVTVMSLGVGSLAAIASARDPVSPVRTVEAADMTMAPSPPDSAADRTETLWRRRSFTADGLSRPREHRRGCSAW